MYICIVDCIPNVHRICLLIYELLYIGRKIDFHMYIWVFSLRKANSSTPIFFIFSTAPPYSYNLFSLQYTNTHSSTPSMLHTISFLSNFFTFHIFVDTIFFKLFVGRIHSFLLSEFFSYPIH